MPNISVSVVDGNNITLVTTPTPTQVITIDRGIAGPAGPAGVPGGSTTQVQYNFASNFAGSPNFTFDDVNRITGTNISEGSVMNASPTNSTKSLLVETQETQPTGCFMRPDGLAFYVIGTQNDDINYYALSTAWDISTATFVSASAAVANTSPQDLFFSPDGLNVFIVGITAPATIYRYVLSIPWDISTITLVGPSIDISSLSTVPTGIWFNPTGTKAYLASNTGTPNDAIHYWDVTTPWSIASFVYGGYISISAQEGNVHSISFSNDGLKFFVVGITGDDINVYKLSIAWDLTTAVFFTNYTFASMGLTIGAPTGMYVSPDGNYAYVINDIASTATVFQLDLSAIEWNATGNLNANGNLVVYQNFSVAGQTSLWKASLSGNLGIGATAHPTIKLYSEKTEDGVIAYFRRTGATINPGIQISFAETTNTVLFATAYAGAVSPAITFQTLAGQDRMRIESNGNVGIGTTNPLVKLEVAGNTGTDGTSVASIAGTTMTVTLVVSGTFVVGDLIYGANIQPYTRITAFGTGTGGIGTYTVSVSQTAASAQVTRNDDYGSTVIRITNLDVTETAGQPTGGLQFYTSDSSAPTEGVGAYVAAMAESQTPDTSLIFGTRNDTGGGVDANERMRLDSSGNLGIGTASPVAKLDVAGNAIISVTDNTNAALRITQLGTGNALLVEDSTNPDSTPFVVDASGKVAIGATTAAENLNLVSDGRNFFQITRASTDTAESAISFRKARGTNAAPTIIASNDAIGTLQYYGYDGTGYVQAASILALMDGAAGVNDMPGRLVFNTTPNGSAASSERMRIDSAGNVIVSTGAVVVYAPAPASISTTATLTNANIQAQIINTTGTTYTVTMPLGTTLETLVPWSAVNLGFNFTVINTASGTITMAVNTGVTAVGTLTVLTGISANFRIRRTAANTFIVYRV